MASTAASAGRNSQPSEVAESGEKKLQAAAQTGSEISASKTETMKQKGPDKRILIIVENQTVPFDRRVWREACSLR